jgi:hypothetical protein
MAAHARRCPAWSRRSAAARATWARTSMPCAASSAAPTSPTRTGVSFGRPRLLLQRVCLDMHSLYSVFSAGMLFWEDVVVKHTALSS